MASQDETYMPWNRKGKNGEKIVFAWLENYPRAFISHLYAIGLPPSTWQSTHIIHLAAFSKDLESALELVPTGAKSFILQISRHEINHFFPRKLLLTFLPSTQFDGVKEFAHFALRAFLFPFFQSI